MLGAAGRGAGALGRALGAGPWNEGRGAGAGAERGLTLGGRL
jgi:hypothetical protein